MTVRTLWQRLGNSRAYQLLRSLQQDPEKRQAIVDLVTMVGIYVFLLSYYRPDLLLSGTTTTGGDTGSHIVLSQYLQDYLLPHSRVIGWYPHWLGGLPMFQFYFVPPYLLMALLGYMIPKEISFKLISALGVFLLPICAYYSMRLLNFKFPAPVLTATFTLLFLFNENYTIYGANIPSTLAGEFSYGISFALAFLAMGLVHNSLRTQRRLVVTTVITALAFLTHVYTSVFLVSVMILLGAHTLVTRNWTRFKQLVKIGIVTFLLVAFWYVPLVAKYSSASPPTAQFFAPAHLGEVFYDNFFIFSTLAFVAVLLAILDRWSLIKRRTWESVSPQQRLRWLRLSIVGFLRAARRFLVVFDMEVEALYLAVSLLVATTIFFVWDYIVTYNHVRFIPIVLFLTLPLAAHAIYRLATKYNRVRRSAAFAALPLVCLLLVASSLTHNPVSTGECQSTVGTHRQPWERIYCYIPGPITFSGSWIRWNYEGLESKATWPVLQSLLKEVAKLPPTGRVDFEYGDYGIYGTPRVFEASPYFTNRSVMEALLLESSLTFPFFYYIQRSVSQTSWWPGFPIALPEFNLTAGAERLRLYNVEYFIASSPTTKQEARSHPDFEFIQQVGTFEIYRVKGNTGYVQVLDREPVLVVTNSWRKFSFQWFSSSYTDTILAYVSNADDYDADHFQTRVEGRSYESQTEVFKNSSFTSQLRQSQMTPLNCTVTSVLKEEELAFTTSCVGKPHLVKISYFPNWQVEGAQKIYLVSPNLMLVFPEQENVRLYYGYTPADVVGNLLTLIGLVLIVSLPILKAYRAKR